MIPLSEVILQGIIQEALKRGGKVGSYSIGKAKKHLFADSDEIERKFNSRLKQTLANQAETSDQEEYQDLLENWTVVEANISDLDTYGLTAEDALFEDDFRIINRVSESLATVIGVDLDSRPELKQELNAAVEEALHDVFELLEKKSKKKEIQDDLSEFEVALSEQITEIKQALADLENHQLLSDSFDIYNIEDEDLEETIDIIAKNLDVNLSIPYVERRELEKYNISTTVVIKGRAGSGKSRSQVELAKRFLEENNIHHLVVTTNNTFDLDDIRQLCNISFEGNVLLIWDDIHKSYVLNRETDIFTATIERLDKTISDTGSEFYVIGSLRSDEIDQIPSYKKPDSIWNKRITEIELGDLEIDEITSLIEDIAQVFDITISEKVKARFGYKVLKSDPSPFYIYSVLSAEGKHGELTEEKVESYSETAKEFWKGHFENIANEDTDSKYLLWSLKILSELRISYYTPLLRGIYHEVFGREKYEFENNLKKLEEKGWIQVINSDLHQNEIVLIHDLQSEAIVARDGKSILDICSSDLSDFLTSDLEQYLPTDQMWVEPILHQNYALAMMKEGEEEYKESQNEIEQHLLRSLSTEYDLPEARGASGRYLQKQGYEKEAEKIIRKGLELNPFSSILLCQYAVLLEETNRPIAAKTQFELAVQQNPPYLAIYRQYGLFLMRQGQDIEAISQFDKAISMGSQEPMDYLSIASIYGSKLDDFDSGSDYLKRATHLPEPGITTYVLYAIYIEELNISSEDPLEYIQKAERIDPTDPEIITYYANYHPDMKDSDFLREILEKEMNATEENGNEVNDTYTLALANLLSESENKEDRKKAVGYYETLLEKGYEHTSLYYDLCDLLQSLDMHTKLRHRLNELSEITTNPAVYFNYGEVCRKENYLEEAERSYLKAFQKSIEFETEYEINEVLQHSVRRLFMFSSSSNRDTNMTEQKKELRKMIMNSDSKKKSEYMTILNDIYHQMI